MKLLSSALLAATLLLSGPIHADPIVPAPVDWDVWQSRHEGFAQQARTGAHRVIFFGDSITDFWRNQGEQVWEREIAPLEAANFGISADRIEHVWWRIQNGELDQARPQVVVLLIGTNNLPGNTVEEISAGHAALVGEIRRRQPQAKLLLLAVFPRADDWSIPFREKIAPVNAALKRLADGQSTYFLDIGDSLRSQDGSLSSDVFFDGLHLTAKGYQLWADAMMPTLQRLLKQ